MVHTNHKFPVYGQRNVPNTTEISSRSLREGGREGEGRKRGKEGKEGKGGREGGRWSVGGSVCVTLCSLCPVTAGHRPALRLSCKYKAFYLNTVIMTVSLWRACR